MRTIPQEESLMLDSELRRRVEAQGPHREEIGAVRPVKIAAELFLKRRSVFSHAPKSEIVVNEAGLLLFGKLVSRVFFRNQRDIF